MKYRKKPVVIEAIQYLKIDEVLNFVSNDSITYNPNDNEYYIVTPEGDMLITYGDFIIKGIKGEFYPCKQDIFNMTYDSVAKNDDKFSELVNIASPLCDWLYSNYYPYGTIIIREDNIQLLEGTMGTSIFRKVENE